MSNDNRNDPILDMFIFETTQLLEQLEQLVINNEKSCYYSSAVINEIFRIMHTIKGSSAMMLFNNISTLAHSIEDLFYVLREDKTANVDYSTLTDLILESVDFTKVELIKIKNGDSADGDASILISEINCFLDKINKNKDDKIEEKNLKKADSQKYYIAPSRTSDSCTRRMIKAVVYFEDGCEMENIRAFTIIHNLKPIVDEMHYFPENIVEDDNTAEIISKDGFTIVFKTQRLFEEIHSFFMETIFLKDLQIKEYEKEEDYIKDINCNRIINDDIREPEDSLLKEESNENTYDNSSTLSSSPQSVISVNISKLDKLMNLVGELVISEEMVAQNPDLNGLQLDNFLKAARHLRKIIDELQDTVMSIRMVPLTMTFERMNRIVRDMCKKQNKNVELKIVGEDTEVDKNIIEHISDPLMHLIRNAIDHGIESEEERIALGKRNSGTVTLEARNAGNEVLIIVEDDGKGLDKQKILSKAVNHGIIKKPENELSDKEIFSYIFLPGFSTNDEVTEFSGRGVGLDVVAKNIEAVGGSVSVESTEAKGTCITMKIPLTLAIIDGMNIKVGSSCYTIPITSIRQSFRASEKDIVKDPDGNEMIMIRGQCYPILRLHQLFNIKNGLLDIPKGIIIMIENDERNICVFADELIGKQQVVVKALPKYIKKVRGVAGCTLLGNGSISLILDIPELISIQRSL
jgi:two-component system, chemotaxis family, sensor kinase CheA